jgi:cyclophilin family peptidyl-prolyl cis-trans isomerase
MFDRKRVVADRSAEGSGPARLGRSPRRALKPQLEGMETRELLAATLSPIATISVPTTLGVQVPLFGGSTDQTFTVTTDNPAVPVAVAQGQFMTINVVHASSGAKDPAFNGSMTFELFGDLTPVTVQRITSLITQGFYSGKLIHRITNNFPGTSDFIVQGGSVDGSGGGNVNEPGFPFPDEFNQQLAFTGQGQLAMANAGSDTNSSQFFITTGSPRFLDFKHTIFGQLVSGQAVLSELTRVPVDSNSKPLSPVTMTSVTLSNTNPNGVLHIDATQSPAGQVAHVTVTAHETSTGAMTSKTFEVDVTPNVDSTGAPISERPAVGTVNDIEVGTTQTAVFQIPTINASNVAVQYTVQGGTTTNGTTQTFTPVDSTKATATVDANGVVTVVPKPNIPAGTVVTLLVGVAPKSATSTDPSQFQFHTLTVTFNGPAVAQQPIATSATQTVFSNTPTTIQLQGNSTNPSQTLTFQILTPPSNGIVSAFNPQTGTFTYTPNKNFQGTDTLTFNVTTVGAPTPNLTSNPATLTINVAGGFTSSVRVIDSTLVITPPPRTDHGTNTITVTLSGGNIITEVNGIIDVVQPNQSDLDSIDIYGTKANDNISISPNITLPATLDGGHGGNNTILGGGGPTTEHGWFGENTLTAGSSTNTLIGQMSHVKFKPNPAGTVQDIYAGVINKRTSLRGITFPGRPHRNSVRTHEGTPPMGTHYKFVGKRLVAVPTPKAKPQIVVNAPSSIQSS